MDKVKIKITDEAGLHLREAANIVKLARCFKSKITLCYKCKYADTCSILDVLSIGAEKGAEVEVQAEGPDEKAALKGFMEYFSDGAGI